MHGKQPNKSDQATLDYYVNNPSKKVTSKIENPIKIEKPKQNKVQKQNSSDLSGSQCKQTEPMYNVQFYRNQRRSAPAGDYIDNIIRQWWGKYDLLQRHHGYIQWLFPNSFSSRFNSQSHALTNDQEKIFRTDIQIATKYIYSYQMMLEFYGMKLKSKVTGQITQNRVTNFKQRYHRTLLTSFHNHMRITRILCSLTMIGLGRYAKQLSIFLTDEIRSEKGNLRLLAKYKVDKDWTVYQDYVQTEQDLNQYLKQADKKSHSKRQYAKSSTKQQKKQQEPQKLQKSQKLQKPQKPSIPHKSEIKKVEEINSANMQEVREQKPQQQKRSQIKRPALVNNSKNIKKNSSKL